MERCISPALPGETAPYTDYFGVPIERGDSATLVFSAEDARRPFLTGNSKLWDFFEPELQKRLGELNGVAPIKDRVRTVLLELLPSGDPSIETVGRKLGMSKRTLQVREAG